MDAPSPHLSPGGFHAFYTHGQKARPPGTRRVMRESRRSPRGAPRCPASDKRSSRGLSRPRHNLCTGDPSVALKATHSYGRPPVARKYGSALCGCRRRRNGKRATDGRPHRPRKNVPGRENRNFLMTERRALAFSARVCYYNSTKEKISGDAGTRKEFPHELV